MPWLAGLLFVGGAIFLGAAGLLVTNRVLPAALRREHNDIAGFIYAVVGVLYAVLLAFMVVAVWEQFNAAEQRVAQEAEGLVSIYRDAEEFPAPHRALLRDHLRRYTMAVVDSEWPAMEHGNASPAARREFHALWDVVHAVEPRTVNEQAWYTETIGRLNQLSDRRELRLLSSRAALPPAMWGVMIAGGLITLGFSLLFGAGSFKIHLLMVTALAAMMGLTLLLVWSLEHPFSGIIRVGSDPFAQLPAVFHGADVEPAAEGAGVR
jgi:hypothetical protein